MQSFGTACYQISLTEENFESARAHCQTDGGDLLWVQSEEEREAVNKMLGQAFQDRQITDWFVGE